MDIDTLIFGKYYDVLEPDQDQSLTIFLSCLFKLAGYETSPSHFQFVKPLSRRQAPSLKLIIGLFPGILKEFFIHFHFCAQLGTRPGFDRNKGETIIDVELNFAKETTGFNLH